MRTVGERDHEGLFGLIERTYRWKRSGDHAAKRDACSAGGPDQCVTRVAVATRSGGKCEHLDDGAGDAHVDLSADQRVRQTPSRSEAGDLSLCLSACVPCAIVSLVFLSMLLVALESWRTPPELSEFMRG
jgi:hypothetical protein